LCIDPLFPLPVVDYGQLPIFFVVLFLSLAVRGAVQAWLVDVLGDPAPAGSGRLSFNPGLQVDAVGSILFPLVSFVTGHPFMGWGKPIPVDEEQLGAHWRRKLLAIAAIGPAVSLGLAVAAALAIRAGIAATHSPFDAIIAPLLFRAVDLNVLLCVLSLLPVPPLEGSTMLAAVLPARAGALMRRQRRLGVVVLFVLLLTGMLAVVVSPIRASLVGALL
jgi:Zn-dependent protease